MTNFRVYVVNLGKYNAGEPSGEWLNLPMNPPELEETLDRITYGGTNDYAIHDYDIPIRGLRIHEYTSLRKLNDIVRRIGVLEQYELDALEVALEHVFNTPEDALDAIETESFNIIYLDTDYPTLTDLGHALVDDYDLMEVPEHLRNYIDYEQIGHDFTLETSGDFGGHYARNPYYAYFY